ncbi:MAG: potassium channel protein [Planctomycetota bacterium]
MRPNNRSLLRWIASRSEALMFSLAFVYLICASILVVVLVDLPGLRERAKEILTDQAAEEAAADLVLNQVVNSCLILMGVIWCIVTAEAVWHWSTRSWEKAMRKHHLQGLLFCICPALRMCARSPEMNGRIWLPGLGWRQGGRRLQRQLERLFSVPMMIVALMIMPLLITEFFLKDQVAAYDWLRFLLHIGTGVIWFAFAAEFILMVSIAEKKIEYCKQHWIDLAIILLPLVSFLRTLSLAKATRLADLMRIQQLTKIARAYRLRGTAIKAFRVLVLFELTERLLRVSDDRKIAKLEKELGELKKQARVLRHKLAKLKAKKQSDSSAESPVLDAPSVGEPSSFPPEEAGDTKVTDSLETPIESHHRT